MSESTKYCPRCKEARPVAEFYVNKGRPDGLSPLCVMHARLAGVESAQKKRREFLEAMGGQCERCGFADFRALVVDHIAGDGNLEEVKNRASAGFYAKTLADRSRYALLCANCNIIKEVEQNETVGRRVYARQTPTEKLQGIGKGNSESGKAKARARLTSEHQAAAGRANKGQVRPAIAAARLGTKLVNGHWVRPDPDDHEVV
jgi:hypothetical protein